MALPSLSRQLLAVHAALAAAGVPHAFGGAIALAYYTLEPRGTRDLDLNVFVAQEHGEAALAAFPTEVERTPELIAQVLRDGQARLWWGDTPVDVFFDNLPIHEQAAKAVRIVSFAGSPIPVLGPVELVVFKAMFSRTKDWADIEAVFAAGAVDDRAVRTALAAMLPEDDVRFARLDDAKREGAAQAEADQR